MFTEIFQVENIAQFHTFQCFLEITQNLANVPNCSIYQIRLKSLKRKICEKIPLFDELKNQFLIDLDLCLTSV